MIEESKLEAKTGSITDVSLGFDETFRRWEARVPWNDPLRIRYESEEGEKTVYIYAISIPSTDSGRRTMRRSSKSLKPDKTK